MDQTYNYQAHEKELTQEKWRGALAQGLQFESEVINWVKQRGHKCWKSDDRAYDLILNIEIDLWGTKRLTAECKTDTTALKTGNLAIQTWERDAPSGIHRDGPNPDLWFHSTGEEMWVIRTTMLRDICKMHAKSWGGQIIKMGNKGPNCQGILMPLDVAKKTVGGLWVML